MDENDLYKKTVELWGVETQIKQAIEECSELITALCHKERGRIDWADVAKEVADVEIMCSQLREIVGPEIVDQCKDKQLSRLREDIETDSDLDVDIDS